MPKRRHPFFHARVGEVYAIAIAPDKWGFVRFFQGLQMGILMIVSDAPVLPPVNWKNPPVGWIFASFAPNDDMTDAVRVAVIPFPDEDSAWAPPCFVAPDLIDNCYKIHCRWGIRRASKEEVAGMRLCQRMTPEKLAAFLREKLATGDLKTV